MALLWVVIAGAAISFILVRSCPALACTLLFRSPPPAQAWSLGANDVANAVRPHPIVIYLSIHYFYLFIY